MKNILYAILVIIILVGGFYWLNNYIYEEKQGSEAGITDHRSVLTEIEGMPTRYFGNETRGDFNGDGTEDVAYLLTASGGGSGTFYYVVAALKTDTGYIGTNAIFLGDRIAPQTTEFRDGKIIVNYAERKMDEPMTVPPSIGVSKYLEVKDVMLVQAIKTEEIVYYGKA
jgi:hypothetical protein